MTPEILAIIRPRLSVRARALLEETAKAEREINGAEGARVADAIRFLLEREDKLAALARNAVLKPAPAGTAGNSTPGESP